MFLFNAKLQDYQQYSIQKFSGVKAEEDAASIARSLREKEFRSKDKYCPECEAELQQRFFEDFGGGLLILDP